MLALHQMLRLYITHPEFANIVEGEPTDIHVIATDGNTSGKLFDVYDLQGNKVRHQTTTLNGLQKGIYIVNGKKVVR